MIARCGDLEYTIKLLANNKFNEKTFKSLSTAQVDVNIVPDKLPLNEPDWVSTDTEAIKLTVDRLGLYYSGKVTIYTQDKFYALTDPNRNYFN